VLPQHWQRTAFYFSEARYSALENRTATNFADHHPHKTALHHYLESVSRFLLSWNAQQSKGNMALSQTNDNCWHYSILKEMPV